MKKIFKSRVFAFVLGALLFGSIGVVSAYTILANDVGYTPKDTTWKKSNGEDITNVKDAIDELYIKKQLSSVSLAGKESITGNTTMTYTFQEDIELGLVIVSASNNINDTSYYIATIQSLSSGNYSSLDNSTSSFYLDEKTLGGHRSQVYVIEGVKKDAILTVATRYAGLVQILKIN